MTENKKTHGTVEKVFLMIKIGSGVHGFTCLLSHKGAMVTWICPSGTHGLVYQVRPIMDVDRHKDSTR
jgi:hypothetical protein